jgi:hypothetical protein
MQKDEIQKALDRFRDHIIKQAKSNLTRMGKNSSKKLYNSITGDVKAMPNSISMEFSMEEYGFYQDQGVSGIKKKYDTPFSYKSKMPPSSKFDKWMVRKGIAPRNEKGQFATRKGLSYVIARSIYVNGIKPSLFFTKPFEAAYKKLPNELIDKFGIEAAKLFMDTITQPKNK